MPFGFNSKKNDDKATDSQNILQRIKKFLKDKKEEKEEDKQVDEQEEETSLANAVSQQKGKDTESINEASVSPKSTKQKIKSLRRMKRLEAAAKVKKLKKKLLKRRKKSLSILKRLMRAQHLKKLRSMELQFKKLLLKNIVVRKQKSLTKKQKAEQKAKQFKNEKQESKDDALFKDSKKGHETMILRKMQATLSSVEKPEAQRTETDRNNIAELGALTTATNQITSSQLPYKPAEHSTEMMASVVNREAVDLTGTAELVGQIIGSAASAAASYMANSVPNASESTSKTNIEKDNSLPEKSTHVAEKSMLHGVDVLDVISALSKSGANLGSANDERNKSQIDAMTKEFREEKYGEMSAQAVEASRNKK